jgi:hypothetical protein
MSDSPAKKLDFSSADKENVFKPIVGIPDLPEEDTTVAKTAIAPTIKPEEAHEPLLQENPNRFVLFPIKYHDVSHSLCFNVIDAYQHALARVKPLLKTFANILSHYRSGKCTRRLKRLSGPPKRLICPRISTTGTSD